MNRVPSLSPRHDPSSTPTPGSLRHWVLAFCIIRFDLEQGQIVDECFPPETLTPDQQLVVAFSSFPDSMSHHHPRHRSSIHDSIFFFRFPSAVSRDTFVYGYVFNRQRHDERLPRGGEQKSVVILSHFPYTSVFRPLLKILGPLCFDIGRTALELVASHVASWPPPTPGCAMDLPIGGAALRAHLPPASDDPSPARFPPSNPSIAFGLFHEADLFVSFRGLLLHLWTLWELMILGEPLLVFAPTPTQCSEAVSALVSLLAPLICSVDFRPYFTIHDPDFPGVNSLPDDASFPPMVLGVTNLFFLKALRSIPHVISVGIVCPNTSRNPSGGAPRSASTGLIPPLGGTLSVNRFSPSRLFNAVKMRRGGPLTLMTEHKEAIWTTYSPITKPDTAILNRLVDAGVSQRIEESMSVVNNEILRRHFLELTTNFLAPFGPYLRAKTPSESSSPFENPPPLTPFHADEFLRSLASRGPGKFLAKRMKSNWLDLYRRFLGGKNFMPWFQKRRAAAEQEQRRLWRLARKTADIHNLISKMSELEIVDSFNSIERHLLEEMQSTSTSSDSLVIRCKLKSDLQAVFKVLPGDLQELLLANPKRAGLLHSSPESPKLPGHPSVQGFVIPETALPFLSI